MVDLPKPTAIIFDWDNTLVDTWPIIHAALVETFTALGKEPWTIEMTRARVRKSMRDSFPEVFGENWQAAGEVYQKAYRANHLSDLTPLPGAKTLLDTIASYRIPSFVVSNKKGGNLRQEIAHLGWNDYFLGISGADDAAKDKPHPDPVHFALKQAEIEPHAGIWFIGDSDIDLECAKNTNCIPILYGAEAAAHAEYTPTHYQTFPYQAHWHNHDEAITLLRGVMEDKRGLAAVS